MHNQYHNGLIQKGICLYRLIKHEIPDNKQIERNKKIFRHLGLLKNRLMDEKDYRTYNLILEDIQKFIKVVKK